MFYDLYKAKNKRLFPLGVPGRSPQNPTLIRQVQDSIVDLVSQKNYPCIAAIKSFHQDEYQVGTYEGFGSGTSWRSLRQDLHSFLNEIKRTNSPYFTFWATYPTEAVLSEDLFEQKMWNELSCLTSEEMKSSDWGTAPSHPEEQSFGLHLFGENFFVVGLHPNSSRKSRQFPFPTLIFNIFRQFDVLKKENIYDPMVKANRIRDVKFQGSANPMALLHGEKWESIQFSGKNNSSEWKCPFRFMKELFKP